MGKHGNKVVINQWASPARSRRGSYFGHEFGQADWRTQQLGEALGLDRKHSVKVFTTFETPGVWVSWLGSNGERYRHLLEDGLMNIDDTEFNVLRIKVRMSTC